MLDLHSLIAWNFFFFEVQRKDSNNMYHYKQKYIWKVVNYNIMNINWK